jgi:hypothetical protein
MPCNFFPLIIQETLNDPSLQRHAVFNELEQYCRTGSGRGDCAGSSVCGGIVPLEFDQSVRLPRHAGRWQWDAQRRRAPAERAAYRDNTSARGPIGAAAPALSNVLQQAPASPGPGGTVGPVGPGSPRSQ